MDQDRREFLSLSGTAVAAFFLAGTPTEVRAALRYARRVVSGELPAAWQYLTAEQAADVEAFSSQIVPSEPDSPGAREAGVVYFLDQSLATWGAGQREPFTNGLDELNQDVAKQWPGTARFSALSPEHQIELLKSREKTPFFQMLRAATLFGFFANPEYGGNRDKVGWKLIGFEDRYAWQPPFGDYDARVAKESH
jgi:gluconate 2-dehydrogenase gamma chain